MSYPVETLESWKSAYIAGILDGEGCFCLSKYKTGSIVATIKVNMTNVKCINLLHTATGVGAFRVAKQVGNWKVQYMWTVRDRLELFLLLKAVCSYLVVKKEHANIMLEFIERRLQAIPISNRDHMLVEEMHKLNK